MFLEFGYSDDVASVARPRAGELKPQPALPDGSETPGMTQQKNILQAFFNVNQALGEPVRGTFLWDNQYVTPASQLCGRKGLRAVLQTGGSGGRGQVRRTGAS